MRILLTLLICTLATSEIFGLDIALGPGLSAKNALVYVAGMVLIVRAVFGRSMKFELRELQFCFVVMAAYALVTLVIAAEVIKYPNYSLVGSAITLQSTLMDYPIFFAVFFYGARTTKDAEWLIKMLLIAVAVANVITITNVSGLTNIGVTRYGLNDDTEGGRVMGVFGHANETGTLIACLLPVYIAVAQSSRGLIRIAWIGAMMASMLILGMTGSRGAIVGLFVGGVWAAVICRQYVSATRIAAWAAVILLLLVPAVMMLGGHFGSMLVDRFTQISTDSAASVSSGRTDIWWRAIRLMMSTPITLFTGFGWNTWSVSGFRYVAHNQYVWLWFELGLVGLVSYILIIRYSITAALSGAAAAAPNSNARRYMVAFVYAILILSVGVFFGLLYLPWPYIWAYVGASMRYAVIVGGGQRAVTAESMSKAGHQELGTRRVVLSSHGGAGRAARAASRSRLPR